MLTAIAILLIVVSLPGTIELLGLTLAALFSKRSSKATGKSASNLKLAILIPAYNEELRIVHTLDSLQQCRGEADILVIADNCTDQTASLAKAHGAAVIERTDRAQRGKDFALSFAFDSPLLKNYDAFLIVDADSLVAPNFITLIQETFEKGADAVQVRYIQRDDQASLKARLLKVGILAMNVLRPLGRQHLGLSVGCFGNGFAIRRSILQAVPWKVRSIVEDAAYHLELIRAGFSVQFLEQTEVLAEPPADVSSFYSQRLRWEGGRLHLLKNQFFPLIKEILQGKWRFSEPLLDLLTLPLTYHCFVLLLLLLLPFARFYALFALAVVLFHLLATIWRCGGEWRDVLALFAAPFYLLWRLFHIGFLWEAISRPLEWTRTKRPGE